MTILANTQLNVSQLRECCPPDHAGSKHALDDCYGQQDNPLKRRPFCRRVPCKARGLSKTHNIDTAFFEIPSGAPHGMLLRCSHPECQASGRKFSFCKVCGIPVAKRNFSKRHGHGLQLDCDHYLRKHSAATVTSMNVTTGSYSAVPRQYQEQSVVSTSEEKMHRPDTSEDLSAISAGMLRTRNPPLQRNNPQDGTPVAAAAPVQLSDEENHWLDLLHQRPNLDDQLSMSSWMDQVLELAESPLLCEDTSYQLSGISHPPVTMLTDNDSSSMTRGRTRIFSSDLDFDTMDPTLEWELSKIAE